MADFLNFSDYGGFIWAAYGLSAFALAGISLLSWRAYSRAKALAKKLGGEVRP